MSTTNENGKLVNVITKQQLFVWHVNQLGALVEVLVNKFLQ